MTFVATLDIRGVISSLFLLLHLWYCFRSRHSCVCFCLTMFRCLLPWKHYGDRKSQNRRQRLWDRVIKFARWQHPAMGRETTHNLLGLLTPSVPLRRLKPGTYWRQSWIQHGRLCLKYLNGCKSCYNKSFLVKFVTFVGKLLGYKTSKFRWKIVIGCGGIAVCPVGHFYLGHPIDRRLAKNHVLGKLLLQGLECYSN